MPRKNSMTWEPAPQFRWSKMFAGKRYRVSCDQLGLPRELWTKEASANHANSWWVEKQAEIERSSKTAHPHAKRLAVLRDRLAWANQHGTDEQRAEVEQEIARVDRLPEWNHANPMDDLATCDKFRMKPGNIETRDWEREVRAAEAAWTDRLARKEKVAPDRTIGALVAAHVREKQDEARAGTRSAQGANGIRVSMTHFTKFVGEASPVEMITAETWHRWAKHLQGQVVQRHADEAGKAGMSGDFAKRLAMLSRSFVRWLWSRDLIQTLPKNLDSRALRISAPDPVVRTFSPAQAAALVGTAKGTHRLILMLMLNCGMTQQDVSDLKKTQIRWVDGKPIRVVRKRSKTALKAGTPTVSYVLWPETSRLLQEHLSADEKLALTTRTGGKWVWSTLDEKGVMKTADNVSSSFRNTRKRAKMPFATLKLFRKTSASIIGNSQKHREMRHLFLGHKAGSMADAHYASHPQKLLDRAVKFLGRKLGFVERSPKNG